MADFTSDDTILSRLHMASSASAPGDTQSRSPGSGPSGNRTSSRSRAEFGYGASARPAASSWPRLYPSRLLHGLRLKRLLLVAMAAAVATIFYLRPSAVPELPSVASIMASKDKNRIELAAFDGTAESANDESASAIRGDIQKLSWAAVTDSPQVDVDGQTVREKGSLAPAEPQHPNKAAVVTTEVCVAFPEMLGVDPSRATQLTHIPAKIWQIYLDFNQKSLSYTYLMSWLVRSPSYTYSVLDAAGALSLVGKLVSIAELGRYRVPLYPSAPLSAANATDTNAPPPLPPHSLWIMSSLAWARDALLQYARFPRRVLRADFLRYLVLALEGGVYSDIDTHLVRAIHDWVPAAHRRHVKLIVGLEADHSPPIPGTTYEVQFCQWTLASAPDHPAMWTMLERILAKTRALEAGLPYPGTDETRNYRKLSDTDVLQITGPAAWTEVVFEHLNAVAGDGVGADHISWETLTGMEEPRLYGDTLVLPIDGFATGVPHSGASTRTTPQTLIRHQFDGKWRDDRG